MARPREFDEDAVTRAAMNLFWEHGYDVTSITMLQEATGLTTGSLYKAFKDKKTFFLKAMARYETEQVAPAVALLTDPNIADPIERIEELFISIPAVVRKGDRRGCLLCSAASGPSFDDTDIANVVDRLMARLRDAFAKALTALPDTENREHLARVLLTQYVGLRTLARAQFPAQELQGNVDALITMLRSRLGS